MTGILLRSETRTESSDQNEIFFCPEESQFYAHCLERLVFDRCERSDVVLEFGCGDGSPIISALLRASFKSLIFGYELNASACKVARSRIEQYNLNDKYIVHNRSFFESHKPEATYLIANPPYLPAPDDNICMPLLYGGMDGASITNRLLELDYPNVMLLLSSYSNPVGTIDWAHKHGYTVADFMLTPVPFGYYSSESKVKNWITKLRQEHKAFYSGNIYFLAGVLFKKQSLSVTDLSAELAQVMTTL